MNALAKIYCNGGYKIHRFGTTYFTRHLGSASYEILATVNKQASYVSSSDMRPILGATIGQLVDIAPKRFGGRMAVIDCAQGIRKTHMEMHEDINKVATGFLALKLDRGDRLAIWCPNRYEWILTHLAACKAGLILVAINPAFQTKELAYCLDKVGAKALVFPESFKTQKYYEMILKLVPEVADGNPGEIKSKMYPNLDTLIVFSDKKLPGTFKFKDVMNAGGMREKEKLQKLQKEIQFDDAATILFTSGTTGKPKAATLSHIQNNNSIFTISQRLGYDETYDARMCVNVPLFHAFGLVGVSNDTVMSGACQVLPAPGFSPEESLKAIEREKCTAILGTPTMFIDMLNHPNFSKTDFSTISKGVIGGAPVPPELFKEIVEKMHCPGLINCYGSTEASPLISTQHFKEDIKIKTTTVGRLVPNIEVKIVDQNDKIVPLGTLGEICSRGFHIMKGYWGDEEKTKEVIVNGWYHTGDIGKLTEDGYLAVAGRINDMIIRGGENIYSKEIEDHLVSHPKISDAQVCGVPDKRMGEELCVWIKLKAGASLTEDEVKGFCKGEISHFKVPRYIRFVDSFPMTASGKVQKYIMQEESIKILGLE